jgi:hypothetical protein
VRVSESWLSVGLFLEGLFDKLQKLRKSATMREKVRYAVTSGAVSNWAEWDVRVEHVR